MTQITIIFDETEISASNFYFESQNVCFKSKKQ